MAQSSGVLILSTTSELLALSHHPVSGGAEIRLTNVPSQLNKWEHAWVGRSVEVLHLLALPAHWHCACLTAHHQLNISAMECMQSRSGHVALSLILGCRSFLNTVLIRCNSWCIEAKQGILSAFIKHSLWVCPLAICCWIIGAIICYYTHIKYKINTNSHKWGIERVRNIALYEFILIIPQFKLVLHVWITILVKGWCQRSLIWAPC